MIRIKNKEEEVTNLFPKNISSQSNSHTLKLVNNLTKKEYTFNVEDEGFLNDYYTFAVDYSALDDGEYTYTISQNSQKKAYGLLMIGDKKNDTKYNSTVKYKQYEGY